jgi:prepilin-type N-terminal cleavage/methylation domain-containing protein
MRRSGFTLIELMVAVVVIGILAALTVLATNESRARARDANRRDSIGNYTAALEQWRQVGTTRSFFVRAGSNCTPSGTGAGYMSGVGADCVGYRGGGAGMITRKTVSNHSATSIAEALQGAGVLTAIRVDPLDAKLDTNVAPTVADFILTTCTRDGVPAQTMDEAETFAIYTQLERPNTTGSGSATDAGNAARLCGGPDTGYGWDTTSFP